MITALQTRPEFMINLVKITGVDAGLDTAVRNAAGVALPQSSLTLGFVFGASKDRSP